MSSPTDREAGGIRFGPVWLAPGISKLNAWAFLFAAFASIALNSFLSIIMPYVLNVNIGLPTGEQGRVAGDLVFYGELVLISLSGFWRKTLPRMGWSCGLQPGCLPSVFSTTSPARAGRQSSSAVVWAWHRSPLRSGDGALWPPTTT